MTDFGLIAVAGLVGVGKTTLAEELAVRFELLAEHFEAIRVTHAFPVLADQPRPVRKPISTIEVNEKFYDRALLPAADLLVDERAPAYFVDAKKMTEFWGAASPKEGFVTRTSIDDDSRRSLEGELFTYSFYYPQDRDGKPVEWVCNVDFNAVLAEVRPQVREQFARAAAAYLDRLGKLNAAARVQIRAGVAPPAVTCRELVHAGKVIVTLQTDALMLDPQDVLALPPGTDLSALYADFWSALSRSELKLVDFFAHQHFQGGYLYHRYLGAAERAAHPNQYYPYYLTGAGSVFILEPTGPGPQVCLERWLQCGLDLPDWAGKKYSLPGASLWQTCPFVPQNGYGEIVVNLDTHWTDQPVSSGES